MTDEPGASKKPGRRRVSPLAFLPVAIFVVLAAIFGRTLLSGRDVSEIPSALIGTKAPSLDLPRLDGLRRDGTPVPPLTSDLIAGKVALVNVWASWCVPCRQEHQILMELAKDDRFTLVGVNYKDETTNALRFLGELGDPFAAVGIDPKGKAAIDWGVYGIPETFLISPDGTIVYKQVGPFTEEAVREDLMPQIEKLLAGE